MVTKNEEVMKQWRVITPILLMILAGIMTFTATVMTSYLGQINNAINSIGSDLKVFMKDTTKDIHGLDTRVKVLESKVHRSNNAKYTTSLEN